MIQNQISSLLNRFKYKYKKLYLKSPVRERDLDMSQLNEQQKQAIKIIKTLASHRDSDILMAPISDKYYLQLDEIFIIIDFEKVSIINSVYHYDIHFGERTSLQITRYLRRVIEYRRRKMEEKIKSKITNSLDHIVEEVKVKAASAKIEKLDLSVLG